MSASVQHWSAPAGQGLRNGAVSLLTDKAKAKLDVHPRTQLDEFALDRQEQNAKVRAAVLDDQGHFTTQRLHKSCKTNHQSVGPDCRWRREGS